MFVKHCLNAGGTLSPLIIPFEHTAGSGLMNPSVMLLGDKLLGVIRHVNYTFYHSEKKIFQHPYGPLTYIHPENDQHLRTINYYVEIDKNSLQISRFNKIDTSAFDDYEPLWDFVGLEDARLVYWDYLYITGVRRDTTTNGQGRMELSKLAVTEQSVKEVDRIRIQPPILDSYCEKNWMPILDKPFHYVKWTNPTEIVAVDGASSKQVKLSSTYTALQHDQRGGSQVVRIGSRYIAITHEVDLFNSPAGRKDAVYRHRFIVWDKDFNLVKVSNSFSFLEGHVEFCVGLAVERQDAYITFGFQDNAAYILKTNLKTIMDFIDA